MTSRTWHKGPPPHVGWWLANTIRSDDLWRWWDGKQWSVSVDEFNNAREAAAEASYGSGEPTTWVEWSDYWPENARVPRVDPALQEARQKHDAEVQDSRRARIEFKALELVKFAADLGFNVTIERRVEPTNPRSDTITVNVWPKRGAA